MGSVFPQVYRTRHVQKHHPASWVAIELGHGQKLRSLEGSLEYNFDGCLGVTP
jgi:hypothetical protein